MSEVRSFNEQGRAAWGDWLLQAKQNPSLPFPAGLLTNPDLALRVPGGQTVEPIRFATKLELAEKLVPTIAAIRAARLPHQRWPGVWDWLAAFYFDSICPADSSGSRKIKALPLYKIDEDWKRYYRHRIKGPVSLFERLGAAARILIYGPPSTLTDWEEQAAGRLPISSNPGIAKALERLYWDDRRNAPKRGASPTEKKPGTLRRFGVLMLQLDRTYDLLSVGADGIIPLLPREFDPFRQAA